MSEKANREIVLRQAILAVQAGNLQGARQALSSLLRKDPTNAKAWLWLGKAIDDPAKREECFARALRFDPDNSEARRGLVALRSGPAMETEPADEPPSRIVAHPSGCSQCGSHMRYDVGTGTLRCSHCGTKRTFPKAALAANWYALPRDLSIPESQTEPIGQKSLHCRSCGAITALSVRTASLACPFCSSPQVVRTETVTPLIPPHVIIPFQVERHEAEQALRAWLGTGILRPGGLAQQAEIIDLHGIYLPFWAFKGLAEVSFRTDGGSMPIQGPLDQKQHIPVKDVLLSASYSLEEDLAEAIGPFHLEEAVQFQPEYLAGWPAEVYQLALTDATIQARERMSKEARIKADAWAPPANYTEEILSETSLVRGMMGWGSRSGLGLARSSKRRRQVSYRAHFWTVNLDSFQHLLLPVWVGSYRHRGQLYPVAVNGQTGKVGGTAPRSAGMVTLLAVLGVAVLALLVGLAVRLLPAVQRWASGQGSASDDNLLVVQLAPLGAALLFVLCLGLILRWSAISNWFKSLWQGDRPVDD
jgi:DNA-directed RNA polymerase subunit RPC12/RpoP